MPGVNRTGLPDSNNIWLGRGSLEFAPLDPATGKPTHFRHLGNVTALSVTSESETLSHTSSRTGIAQVDREIVTSQKLNISFTLDHTTDFGNLALFLSGSELKDQANAARSAGGSVTDVLIHADALPGRTYELRDANGGRLYNLSTNTAHLELKSAATTLPVSANLIEGPDYTVDRVWGTVTLLSTGAFVSGHSLWFKYTRQGSEQFVDMVQMLTTSKLSGFLRYKGINPANQDKKILVDFHSVSVKADGEVQLIGEEFSTLTFTGVAERNELGYPTNPVGAIYTHPDA